MNFKKFRILYSSARKRGSAFSLERHRESLSSEFNLKIFAHSHFVSFTKWIDWLQDPLFNLEKQDSTGLRDLLGKWKYPRMNRFYLSVFRKEVESFNPDLILSDRESISLALGKTLGIETWDISSGNFFYGWDEGVNKKQKIRQVYDERTYFAPPDKIFAPSPLYKLGIQIDQNKVGWLEPPYKKWKDENLSCAAIMADESRPTLKKIFGTERVPFFSYSLNGDFPKPQMLFGSCETTLLSDAIFSEVDVCHPVPYYEDEEQILNSAAIKSSGWGYNMGQLEKMKFEAMYQVGLRKLWDKEFIFKSANYPSLVEKIKEYAKTKYTYAE